MVEKKKNKTHFPHYFWSIILSWQHSLIQAETIEESSFVVVILFQFCSYESSFFKCCNSECVLKWQEKEQNKVI